MHLSERHPNYATLQMTGEHSVTVSWSRPNGQFLQDPHSAQQPSKLCSSAAQARMAVGTCNNAGGPQCAHTVQSRGRSPLNQNL